MARPPQKKRFEFPDAQTPSTEQSRVAHALEYIAHHLSQIDDHLEKIANQQPGAGDKIALHLISMDKTMQEILGKM